MTTYLPNCYQSEIHSMHFSDTGKSKACFIKDRFMVNQENERPDQQRRSVKHDIVPTWDEVHKGQLIAKAIFHGFPCSKKTYKFNRIYSVLRDLFGITYSNRCSR